MYKKFYGFQEMPFSLVGNSNEKPIFLSQNYTKVLPPLVSSLNQKFSLKLVLGEDGVGKSTFINYLFNFFPKVLTAKLISVHFNSTQDFFKQVLISFGLKDSNDTSYDMLLQLSFFLSTKFKEQDGQSTLLIIDNADKLSLDVLQGIELLLGLNVEDNQVLQIILVGQPNIEFLQNVRSLYELLQNTSSHYILEPLTAEETQEYINYKINLAGGRTQNNKIFDEQACSIIYEYSEGIPSIINWICDKSLIQSCLLNKRKISSELVFEVVNDQIDISEKKNTISLAPSVFVSGFVFTGIALTFFLSNHLSSFSKEIPNKQETVLSKNLKNTSVKDKQKEIPSEQEIVLSKNLKITSVKAKQKEISNKQETVLSNNLKSTSVKDKQKLARADYQGKNPEKLAKKEVFTEKILTKEIKNSTPTIEVQLALAERQIGDLKLTRPKHDNAYETYTAILKDTPNEKRATKGLQFIANFYLKRARKQLAKGMLAQSQRTVSIGLKTWPNHKELSNLDTRINYAKKQKIKLARISHLFKQADQQIERLQLIKPTNNNAYKSYQEIIALDKNNVLAKDGMQKVLSQINSQTQKALFEKNYSIALKINKDLLTLSSEGVNDDPFHKIAIFTALETKKNIINKILILAEKQRKMQKLTQPNGDNAFESYKTVLQTYPNNVDALSGLDDLKTQYRELAKVTLLARKADQSLTIISEGLKAFPNDQLLMLLKSNAKYKQKAQKNKVATKKSNKKQQVVKSFGTF